MSIVTNTPEAGCQFLDALSSNRLTALRDPVDFFALGQRSLFRNRPMETFFKIGSPIALAAIPIVLYFNSHSPQMTDLGKSSESLQQNSKDLQKSAESIQKASNGFEANARSLDSSTKNIQADFAKLQIQMSTLHKNTVDAGKGSCPCKPELDSIIETAESQDNTTRVRIAAIQNLGQIGKSAAPIVRDLRKLLERTRQGNEIEKATIILEIIITLGKIGPDACQALRAINESTGIESRIDEAIIVARESILAAPAGHAAAGSVDKTVQTLLDILKDQKDAAQRLAAAKSLGALPATTSIADLSAALMGLIFAVVIDSDTGVRIQAMESAKVVSDQAKNPQDYVQLLKVIIANVKDVSKVRVAAAKAAGDLNLKDAECLIATLLDKSQSDADNEVQQAAKNSLAKLVPPPKKSP
jgi:hypothetical protein